MKAFNAWITLAMAFAAAPALAQTPSAASPARGPQTNWWSEAGGENGPERIVWAAQKTPETPYTGVNKPIWHIADILKSHQGSANSTICEVKCSGRIYEKIEDVREADVRLSDRRFRPLGRDRLR